MPPGTVNGCLFQSRSHPATSVLPTKPAATLRGQGFLLKEILVLVLQPLNMWVLELLVSGHFARGLNRLDRIRIGSLVNKAE